MTGERARLFVALELSADVRSALTKWRAAVLELTPLLRAMPAESLHVTLCFLGMVPIEAIPSLASACEQVVDRRRRGEIPLVLADALWLPPRRPRVLTVAIDDRSGGLAQIQGELSASLASGGWYEPETRPFLAHVTVARVPGRERLRPVELPPVRALEFSGSTVTLYRSRPGSQYEPLLRAAL